MHSSLASVSSSLSPSAHKTSFPTTEAPDSSAVLAPAAVCASLLNAEPEGSSWRVRPIVGALALNAMLLVGYEVWHHIPPRPPWPPEFIVPRTDIYGPRVAILKLELMALRCMEDATAARGTCHRIWPSSPSCWRCPWTDAIRLWRPARIRSAVVRRARRSTRRAAHEG